MDQATEGVVIRLPPDPRYLKVARMTASVLGADLGLSMDDLAELKVAVDELGAAVLGDVGEGPLELRYEVDGSSVVVHGRRAAKKEALLDPIAVELLAMSADAHELTSDDGDHCFVVRKGPSGAGRGVDGS